MCLELSTINKVPRQLPTFQRTALRREVLLRQTVNYSSLPRRVRPKNIALARPRHTRSRLRRWKPYRNIILRVAVFSCLRQTPTPAQTVKTGPVSNKEVLYALHCTVKVKA